MTDKKAQVKELIREIEKGLCKKYSGLKLKVLRKDIEEALEKTKYLKDCVLRIGTDSDLNYVIYTLEFKYDDGCFIKFYGEGAKIFVFFDHFTKHLIEEIEKEDFDEKALVEKMRKFIEEVEFFINELMSKRRLEVKLEYTISKLEEIEENLTKGGIDMCGNKENQAYEKIRELEKTAEKVLKELEKKLYEKYKHVKLKVSGDDLIKTLEKTRFLRNKLRWLGDLESYYMYDIYFIYGNGGCDIYIEGPRNAYICISDIIKYFHYELTTINFDECAFIEQVKEFLDEVEFFVNELSKTQDFETKLDYVINELTILCNNFS